MRCSPQPHDLCLLNPAITAYSAVRYVPDIRLRSTVTRLISDNQPLDQRSSTARSASVNYFIARRSSVSRSSTPASASFSIFRRPMVASRRRSFSTKTESRITLPRSPAAPPALSPCFGILRLPVVTERIRTTISSRRIFRSVFQTRSMSLNTTTTPAFWSTAARPTRQCAAR